jgi:hypothetical protein
VTARDSVVYTLVLADVGPRSIAGIGALSALYSPPLEFLESAGDISDPNRNPVSGVLYRRSLASVKMGSE